MFFTVEIVNSICDGSLWDGSFIFEELPVLFLKCYRIRVYDVFHAF